MDPTISSAALSDTPPPASPEGSPVSRIIAWRSGEVSKTTDIATLHALRAEPDTCLWVDLVDPSPELVGDVGHELELHRLVAEDIVERNQRAKIETFGEVVHIVLFALRYEGEATASEIDFVLGDRFLVSVHGPDIDLAKAGHIRTGTGLAMGKGADFLFYALVDYVVDGYFPVLDALAEEIDDLQDRVVARADQWTLERLFTLKRELLAIRRATSPAREIFNQLTNREVGPIAEAHVVYFRDVYDHLIRVTDELDNYRELVAGTLDIYLTIVNNNLSIIMKRLTGVTVILAGIGAIAGIFGMSEAGNAFNGSEATGFWLVSGATVTIATLAAVVLRRIDWI
jgi:magnesium transporter